MLLKYFIGWFGLMIIAIINGASRELLYKPYTGELQAHQIATVILLLLITIYFLVLNSFWPIGSPAEAWLIGGMWVVMTLAFEVGIGRFVSGNSWSKVLYDYNLLAGRVWIFVPIWILFAPSVIFRLRLNH